MGAAGPLSLRGRARSPGDRPARLRGGRENLLLRRVDWRFLLHATHAPTVLDLARGRLAEALPLVGELTASAPADLVVVSRPTRRKLARARAALQVGGELYCEWRLPRPAGIWRARRTLRRAGFVDIRIHWPGPWPAMAAPHFWLSLDCDPAIEHLLRAASRPGPWAGAARLLWRLALRTGLLAPLCVVARRGPLTPDGERDGDRLGPQNARWLLLTPGSASINKVIAIPFGEWSPARRGRRPGPASPIALAKFARVSEAEAALRREAHALRALEAGHPGLRGAPRVLGTGRRAGRLGLAQTAVPGRPLMDLLSAGSLPEVTDAVTRWLLRLAGAAEPQPRSAWWPRLVESPLRRFEADFGPLLPAGTLQQIRRRLEPLSQLPIVFEHRDCAPWNIVWQEDGEPALLDWESAEPRGLPALDLVYFLANAAFVIERALERHHTRRTYRRLLDPGTPLGALAQRALRDYARDLRVDVAALPGLRLLCWLIHSQSDLRHLALAASGPPVPEQLRAGVYFGLVMEELRPDGADSHR